MAMALLDAAVPAPMFRVHAVDISHRALAAARLGLYRKVSFRGQDLEYRRRFFEPTAAGFRVFDSVREQVEFRHGNLLRPASLPGAGTYDAVFCRNVLIYFDRATQERAIAALTALLTAGRTAVCRAGGGTRCSSNHGLVSATDAESPCLSQRREGGQAAAPVQTAPGTREAAASRACREGRSPPRTPSRRFPLRLRARARPRGSSREGNSRIRGGSSKRRSSAKTMCAGTARQSRCSIFLVSCAMPSVTRPMLPPPIAKRCTSTRAITRRSCIWRC